MERNLSAIAKIRFCGFQSLFFTEYEGVEPILVEGHLSLLIRALMQKFGHEYQFQLSEPENEFGTIFGEGNGTGLLGYLVRNESDLALFTTVPDHGNFRYLDYINVMGHENYFILSSKCVGIFQSTDFAFISIFSSSIWLAIGLCLLAFSVVWHLTERLLPRHSIRASGGRFLDTYAIALNQGVDLPPSRLGHSRVSVYCWIISCFLLNCAFSGCLLSKLTLPPQPIRIDKIKDILDHPNVAVLVAKNTISEAIFKGSSNEEYRRVWDRIVRLSSSVAFENMNYGYISEEMTEGRMITFLPKLMIRELSPFLFGEKVVREFYVSKESSFKTLLTLPLRKGVHPEKTSLIKRTVQKLFEADLIYKSLRLVYWKNTKLFLDDVIPPQKLQLSSIRVFSYGLLLGMAISTVTVLLEFKTRPSIHSG